MKPPQKRTKDSAAQDDAEHDRIAKVLARAGLCSRRDAERLIQEGRVAINGRVLTSPAVNVGPNDRVTVDDQPLPTRERTRLWLYHKPRGLVTTAHDPEGRPTVFDSLPAHLPRVIAVGRLDINTEGLLLLTNDGGLARVLELPSTGWMRRYRVRAWGDILQPDLDKLKDGVEIDGVMYGAIEGTLDRIQGSNVWATIGLREGKNREVKKVLSSIGLDVNRLIRVSYGPFQLGDLAEGEAVEIKGRVLRDQLGEKLAKESGADFDAPLREEEEAARRSNRKSGGRTIHRGPIKPLAQVKPTGERPTRRRDEAEEAETGGRRSGRPISEARRGRDERPAEGRGEGNRRGGRPISEARREANRGRDERPAEGRTPRGEGGRGRGERSAESAAPGRTSHRGAARGRGRGEFAEAGEKREFQDGRRFEGSLRNARPVTGRNPDGDKPKGGRGGSKPGRSFDKRPVTGRNPDGDKPRGGGRPGGRPSSGGRPGGSGSRTGGTGRADRRR
ncbi:pseudouridine synthase [Kaistia nematophila]|uniref:Pseudouridine synthase n=1 Tax=Kaistia nematophila TaxID=2994654 RepID=A0A9X3E4U0_9HYPH|nr:pseudouridine synthase [Kaistia nematophila]MCX5570787.1 pseudouridine synthase [Kaistia nematophila]